METPMKINSPVSGRLLPSLTRTSKSVGHLWETPIMESSKTTGRQKKNLDKFGMSCAKSKVQTKQITSSLRAMIEHADQEVDRLDVEWMNLEHIARKKLQQQNEPDSKPGPSLKNVPIATNKNIHQTNKQIKETPIKVDLDEFLDELPDLNLNVNVNKSSGNADCEEFDSD